MKVIKAVKAVQIAFKNMALYPGLFMLLNRIGNKLPPTTADEIARVISKPMTGDEVDWCMAIIDPYLDEPATA